MGRRGMFVAISGIALGLMATLSGVGWSMATWSTEVVDGGDGGFYNSLAYDPTDGRPSIGYVGKVGTKDRLKFAHFNGSGWTIENVTSGNTGVSLAYDPIDHSPTMSFSAGSSIKFARKSGASWTFQTIETAGVFNDVTSLAYDAQGDPSVAYHVKAGQKQNLKLARWSGSAWVTELVEAGVDARSKSLSYGSDGNPAIAYSDNLIGNDTTIDTLKYARWNGTAWEVEIVESGTPGFGAFAGLAHDPVTGDPAVVHRTSGSGAPLNTVRFLRRIGGGWDLELVESNDPGAGGFSACSLRYDGAGTAFVSYVVAWYPVADLRVARRDAEGWAIETVEQLSGQLGGYTSLGFNPAGSPAVAYQNFTNRDLKFALRIP